LPASGMSKNALQVSVSMGTVHDKEATVLMTHRQLHPRPGQTGSATRYGAVLGEQSWNRWAEGVPAVCHTEMT